MAKIKAETTAEETVPEVKKAKNSAPTFAEYEVKITNTKEGPTYEKLKVSRKAVKITQEEAEALNAGVLHGGNTYTKMYFPNE